MSHGGVRLDVKWNEGMRERGRLEGIDNEIQKRTLRRLMLQMILRVGLRQAEALRALICFVEATGGWTRSQA
jgi:hypothetical protein